MTRTFFVSTPAVRARRTLRFVLFGVAAATLGVGGLPAVAVAAAGNEDTRTAASDQSGNMSKANRLLFTTEQLDNVSPPKQLRYRYSVSGTTDDFNDRIDVDLRPDPSSAGPDARVDFLTGERHRYVPEISDVHSNPITKIFLQHDVYTLGQETGGSWHYFQREIKLALENDADIRRVQVQYHGESVPATRIKISPFADMTSHRGDMGAAVGKQYTFWLSDAVPGHVVKINSVMAGGDEAPDNVHELTLQSVTPIPDEPANNNAGAGENTPTSDDHS